MSISPTQFHDLQLKHGLSIEIKTGLKFSKGSLLKVVNQKYGKNFRTKQQAYEFMCEVVESHMAPSNG